MTYEQKIDKSQAYSIFTNRFKVLYLFLNLSVTIASQLLGKFTNI